MESSPEFMQLPLDYQVCVRERLCRGAGCLCVPACASLCACVGACVSVLCDVCPLCALRACTLARFVLPLCVRAGVLPVDHRESRRAAAARRPVVGHRAVRASSWSFVDDVAVVAVVVAVRVVVVVVALAGCFVGRLSTTDGASDY